MLQQLSKQSSSLHKAIVSGIISNMKISNMKDSSNTLEAWVDGKVIFSSRKHWLVPLVELGGFLSSYGGDVSKIELHDTKAGRAAAGMAIRLGIRKVVLDLASEYALELYRQHSVEAEAREVVPLINCATERLITPDMTPEQIFQLVTQRMQAAEAGA